MYDNKASHINWREQDLYGSSRLGMFIPNVRIGTDSSYTSWNTMGLKRYELANHLGNVMATITDRRLQAGTSGDTVVTKFDAEVVNAQDYNSFGSIMEGRQLSTADSALYRYGFNGKENDNDVGKGIGGEQDYGARIYDPRIGRFLSIDPLTKSYPNLTPYQFASNTPIQATDIDGKEADFFTLAKAGLYGETTQKIVRGTTDGVSGSIEGTWNFFTRDAWKAETWEQTGYLIEETALSSSPFSNIYNPNTPRLDAAVKSFNDKVVHGDAYTRSKFGARILTDLATAYASSKGLGELESFGSRVVETPWELRKQSTTAQAIAGYIKAKSGSTLYRLGTYGKSATGADAQFWALENPLSDPEAYAKKYNVPLSNINNADFIETATVKKGANFITQEAGSAPGSANTGKGIEVVTDRGGTTDNVITPIKKP